MDYAVEKCIDGDGNQRCSAPFLVSKDTCYELEWSTEGTLTHTTVEVRDAKSAEIVYYRDTNGQWTAEKGEVSAPTMSCLFFLAGRECKFINSSARTSLSTSTSNQRFTTRAMTLSRIKSPPVMTRGCLHTAKKFKSIVAITGVSVVGFCYFDNIRSLLA
jgi:hypothetical protein